MWGSGSWLRSGLNCCFKPPQHRSDTFSASPGGRPFLEPSSLCVWARSIETASDSWNVEMRSSGSVHLAGFCFAMANINWETSCFWMADQKLCCEVYNTVKFIRLFVGQEYAKQHWPNNLFLISRCCVDDEGVLIPLSPSLWPSYKIKSCVVLLFLVLNSQKRKVGLVFSFPVSEWQLRNLSNPLAAKSTDLKSSHFWKSLWHISSDGKGTW